MFIMNLGFVQICKNKFILIQIFVISLPVVGAIQPR